MSCQLDLEKFKNYVNVSLYRMEHSGEYNEFTDELSTNAKDSYEFALYTNRRFEKGEHAISQDIYYSALYARNVIGKHFDNVDPLLVNAESIASYLRWAGWLALPDHLVDILKTDAKSIVDYCRYAVSSPIPDAEEIIATCPVSSFRYASIWNKPFPLGEPAIAAASFPGAADNALQYAKYCLKGPFKEAEKLIASDSRSSFEYAEVLNRRFELGEPALLKLDEDDWRLEKYCRVYKEIRPYSIWHPIRNLYKLLGV